MGESSADVERLLGEMLTWRLFEKSLWRQVDDELRKLGAFIEAGDTAGVTAAELTLRLWAGRRPRHGIAPDLDKPVGYPVPDGTRDLINRLVHRIGLIQAAGDAEGDREHDGTDGDRDRP
jgi:hypothetical protein